MSLTKGTKNQNKQGRGSGYQRINGIFPPKTKKNRKRISIDEDQQKAPCFFVGSLLGLRCITMNGRQRGGMGISPHPLEVNTAVLFESPRLCDAYEQNLGDATVR